MSDGTPPGASTPPDHPDDAGRPDAARPVDAGRSSPPDGPAPDPTTAPAVGTSDVSGPYRASGDYAYFGPDSASGSTSSLPYASEPTGQPRRRRSLIIAAFAAVVVLILGGGAFALYAANPGHLFRAGPQAAEAVPASALAYAAIDLDPKASQKVDALLFLDHFTAFKDSTGVTDSSTDVRALIFSKLLASTPCRTLTYDATVEPWIGTSVGFAMMPPAAKGKAVQAIFVVQVNDQSKATAGLSALRRCAVGRGGKGFGYAYANGFVVLAATQASAVEYANQAQRSPLSDDAGFKSDMDGLGDLGVASTWFNLAAVAKLAQSVGVGGLDSPQMSDVGQADIRLAATLRFSSTSAEFAANLYGDSDTVPSIPANKVTTLPDSTVFAASISGGGAALANNWQRLRDIMSKQDPEFDSAISQLEAQTGLVVPDDLETLLGTNLMFAVDSHGLTGHNLGSGDLSKIDAGVRFTSDPAALKSVYGKIVTLLSQETGSKISPSTVDTSDGMVLATNDGYAHTLASGGDLGDSSAFKSVIDDASSQQAVVYLDWDAIEGQVFKALDASGSANAQQIEDNLRPVRAIGLESRYVNGHSQISFKVSLDD